MIRNSLVAAALGVACLSGTAHAQKFEYDCDTQAEHFSVLKVAQGGPTYSATATITMREMFAVKNYVTLGGFAFEAADGSWSARLRLEGLAVNKKSVLMGTLAITRGGKDDPEVPVGAIFDYAIGTPYPIKFTLGADGGSATLGTTTVPVNLKASGQVNVSVICSGGEFLLTDLDMGR